MTDSSDNKEENEEAIESEDEKKSDIRHKEKKVKGCRELQDLLDGVSPVPHASTSHGCPVCPSPQRVQESKTTAQERTQPSPD